MARSDSALAQAGQRRDKSVLIRRTRLGKGVFAQQRYLPEAFIGEIAGDIIDDPDYVSSYCFCLENGQLLEPRPPFRFLNHSCEANCDFDFCDVRIEVTDQVERLILLFALREIKPGEELTIDYNWPQDATIPCRCRAPSCCGWIVGPAARAALAGLSKNAPDG